MPSFATERLDRIVFTLLWFHVVALFAITLFFQASTLLLLPIVCLALVSSVIYKYNRLTLFRYLALYTFSFTTFFLIHLSNGLTEMHFHIFFVLILFSFYLNERLLLAGGLLCAFHHSIAFFFFFRGVYPYHVLENAHIHSIHIWNLHMLAIFSITALLMYFCRGARRLLIEIMQKERSEQYHLLQQQDHFAALGQIAASIAHEIRNPLTSIKGFNHLLKHSESPSASHTKYHQIIDEEITRIDRLIKEVLILSKSHTYEEQWTIISLEELLSRMIMLIEPECNKQNITIRTHLEEQVTVRGIEDKLGQLFLNILRNAVEAIESSGHIVITLTRSPANTMAIVQITDDGPGASEEVIEQMFAPFFTMKETGTGLGLPVCKSIAETHQGTIHVICNKPFGLTFEIELPLYISSEEASE